MKAKINNTLDSVDFKSTIMRLRAFWFFEKYHWFWQFLFLRETWKVSNSWLYVYSEPISGCTLMIRSFEVHALPTNLWAAAIEFSCQLQDEHNNHVVRPTVTLTHGPYQVSRLISMKPTTTLLKLNSQAAAHFKAIGKPWKMTWTPSSQMKE